VGKEMRTIKEKMATPAKSEVQLLKRRLGPSFPAGKMLISTPTVIDHYVRKIRKGTTITIGELRERLAKDFRADYTCPLTTGIFLRVVAENAELERAEGKARIAPYWRVIRNDGAMNPKFPGGANSQAKLLKAEGVSVVAKGKNLKVIRF
jgi:hypothetical protein